MRVATGTTSRSAVVVLVAVLAAVTGLVTAAPVHADPAETERQLDATWNKLEKVGETYKQNEADLRRSQRAAAQLARQIKPLRDKVDAMYADIGVMAAAAYKGGDLRLINSIMEHGSAGTMLDQVSTLDRIAADRHRKVAAYERAKRTLDAKKATLDRRIAADRVKAKRLKAQKARIEKQMKDLQAKRAREISATSGADYVPPYIPGAAGEAVRFAYAQLGKPYVWNTAGPDTYDCSGLTMAAWATVGVGMQHYTVSQYNAFPKVSRGELQPGDLLFWNNLQHEAMYVGNGYAIHAPTPGENVKVSSMSQLDYIGPYDGAVRPA